LRQLRPCAALLSLLVLAAFIAAGCEKEDVLATVNGEKIMRDAWRRKAELAGERYATWLQQRAQAGQPLYPVGYYALDQLILEKILYQLAKTEGVTATPQEVEDYLQRAIRKKSSFLDDQKMLGRNKQSIKDEIRAELTRFNLQTKGVKVSDAEVDEYIKLHPEDFTYPAVVTFRIIAVKNKEDEAAVDKDLQSGMTFAMVATNRSEDDSKKVGGLTPQKIIKQLPAEIQQIVAETPVGKYYTGGPPESHGWQQVREGYLRLYIDSKNPEQYTAPNADQKWLVKRSMMQQKAADQSEFQDKLVDAVTSAKVEVNETYLATMWKGDAKMRVEFLKQQKQKEKAAETSGKADVTGGTTGIVPDSSGKK
jgi:RNA-binding protein YhbY